MATGKVNEEKSKALTSIQIEDTRKMEEVVIQPAAGNARKATNDKGDVDLVKTRDDLTGKVSGVKDETIHNKESFLNVINGRVTDQNNVPIPNASLQVANYKNYFNTDKSGFFKIPATDSVVDVSVAVVGYSTQKFRLQQNNMALNQLRLQPANNNLNEAIVTPQRSIDAKKSKNSGYTKVMVQAAQPVYGWVAYEKYLEENKRIPAGNPGVTGEVVVSFQVNNKGALAAFKIEQSLAKGYDEEAIRLIKEGPSWKLLNSRKTRITIIVRF